MYGDKIIDEYAKKLVVEVGKKYNRSTLFRMKQFYNLFSNEKVAPLAQQLNWSHYVELLPIKDKNKLMYYLNISMEQHLSKRDLREKIKNKEYERLPKKTKVELIKDKKISGVFDYIKEPILIKNCNNYSIISEKILQKLILEDIEGFMKELGNSFSFIGSEYKIKLGNRYNYIDLLLFKYEYNSFVVVELKVTELKKEHIGQIEVYMNYIDENLKKVTQDKTIGIIICKQDNKYVIKYCSDKRIIAREYKFV